MLKNQKEYSELKNIVDIAKNYLNYEKNVSGLNLIINDPKNDEEMTNMAKQELEDFKKTKKNSIEK